MKKESWTIFKKGCFAFLSLLFLLIGNTSYALPFDIVPTAGTTLPTTVNIGSTSTAYYTVSNKTGSQRNNNAVKYLPPNVSHITNGGAGTCGSTFNLAPSGHTGDSCTLQLRITGAVNGSDTNPQHHLFVCFPGGRTCAGTQFPLNVKQLSQKQLTSISVTPTSATVPVNSTQQYTAIGTYADSSTLNITSSVTWNSSSPPNATIAAGGLATATNIIGTSNITAMLNGITSNTVVLTIDNPLVSISVTAASANLRIDGTQQYTATGHYADGSTANFTTSVTWASSTPSVATITPGPSGGLAKGSAIGSSTIIATLGSTSGSVPLAISNFAYYSSSGASKVFYAPIISTTGAYGPFTQTENIMAGEFGVAVTHPTTPNTPYAYLTTGNSTSIYFCPINFNGSLGTCNPTSASAPAGIATFAIAINPRTNATAYITSNNTDINMTYCTISPTTGDFTSCTLTTTTEITGGSQGIAVNHTGGTETRAYFTSATPAVFACTINNTTGDFTACQNTGATALNGPIGIAIDPTDTYALIANNTGTLGQNVTRCLINTSTPSLFSQCNVMTISPTIESPSAIAIDAAGVYAYITTSLTNGNTYQCTIDSVTPALTNCTTTNTGSGSLGTGIALF